MASCSYSGGCLCGSVRYEISGESSAFFHCHCQRCRKASGTGHASNLLVKPERAQWIAGEDLLGSYALPGAKRFRTVFCRNCGSPLPRVAPDLSLAVIPAGSLDSAPDIDPSDRIFWSSRTNWSCGDGELPSWDEYPG